MIIKMVYRNIKIVKGRNKSFLKCYDFVTRAGIKARKPGFKSPIPAMLWRQQI
jgi:hypothetical protein